MSEEKLDKETLSSALDDSAKKEEAPKAENKEEEKPLPKGEKEEDLMKEKKEYQRKFHEAEEKFEAADKERESWKNKYYEVYADMANMRKQLTKESDDFKRYANQDFIKELIPTLDAFDMALKSKPADPTILKYTEGFQMIHKKLLDALASVGVEIIDPKPGEEYDPNKMEALSTVEGEDDNKVVDTFLKGYKLKDHLLRASRVVISIKKAETKEETKDETKKDEEKK